MNRRTLVLATLIAAACAYTEYRNMYGASLGAPAASPIRGSGSAPGVDPTNGNGVGAAAGAGSVGSH